MEILKDVEVSFEVKILKGVEVAVLNLNLNDSVIVPIASPHTFLAFDVFFLEIILEAPVHSFFWKSFPNFLSVCAFKCQQGGVFFPSKQQSPGSQSEC